MNSLQELIDHAERQIVSLQEICLLEKNVSSFCAVCSGRLAEYLVLFCINGIGVVAWYVSCIHHVQQPIDMVCD